MEVLTRPELLVRLGGRRALDTALATGAWSRVMYGAYVPAGVVLDLVVRARAAQRLLPAHAYVADRCLLWLLGVDVLPPGTPVLECVVPRGVVLPRRQGLRVREAALPRRDRYRLHDVRCLRPTRAVADLLRRLPLAEAVVVADASRRARLCTEQQLRDELLAHAKLRGVRQARDVLDLSDPRAESPPESRVRLLLVQAGLAPVPQYDVFGPDGDWLARVDLAFPELRIAVEYDGRAVHERADVFTRDRQRQNALVAAGWVVLRFSAEDLRLRKAQIVQTVLAAVGRAQQAA
jgi:hypothetical protein